MVELAHTQRRRGRPPKQSVEDGDTRAALLRVGVAVLTEKGFASAGIEEILVQAGVPKGSFYHYFASKEVFGLALIGEYDSYFCRKLDHFLSDETQAPLQRLAAFVADARAGMARFDFRRGCLIGNLGQEMGVLPASFRQCLIDVLTGWQDRTARCLRAAQKAGDLHADLDCAQLSEFFWIGWEGAVLRARLERNAVPLDRFAQYFFHLLGR